MKRERCSYQSIGDGPTYLLGDHAARKRIILELARAALREDPTYARARELANGGDLFERIARALGRTRPFINGYFKNKATLLRAAGWEPEP